IEEVLAAVMSECDSFAGVVLTSGSSGTLGCGDYLKEKFPASKIAVGEALQCPTLLLNGFGGHRIEGIGDKHVPWIHNVKNTDMVIAVDDERAIRLMRLFNEPVGREALKSAKVPDGIVDNLDLLGISSIANLIASIKFAKYYELTERDIVFTVFTDSMELYESRLREAHAHGEYTATDAAVDLDLLMNITCENTLELDYYGRKRIHNLKYYTWIEQQAKRLEELNAQWHDREYWPRIHELVPRIDELIEEFNWRVLG
ncbi:pyridoxal-5-phosphate-dependent protein subunit beta, partial [bacterium]